MLDIRRIRQNPEALVTAMKNRRNKGADVTALLTSTRSAERCSWRWRRSRHAATP